MDLLASRKMAFLSLLLCILVPAFTVVAQPSPEVQQRISAAIAAANSTNGTVDYTAFVNPFIGTGETSHLNIISFLPKHRLPQDNDGDVW